jgi:3-hydroxyisobutyrate dehydrogenase-like beta-hydroxyacid dehydrogenase
MDSHSTARMPALSLKSVALTESMMDMAIRQGDGDMDHSALFRIVSRSDS